MKIINYILCVIVVATFASCSNGNKKLQKMIPADAAGVVSINVGSIVDKAQLDHDGKVKLPRSLEDILDKNDQSPLCKVVMDLPVMGLDMDCNAYAFLSGKTFSTVYLVALDDEKAARKVVEGRVGGNFESVDGLDCIYREDYLYAIDDDVLLVGHVSRPMEVAKAAQAARKMMSQSTPSILDDNDVDDCINDGNDIDAYLRQEGVKMLAAHSKMYNDIASKMPLLEIFTESDVKAYVCSLNFNDDKADIEVDVKADKGSQYEQLLASTLGAPSVDFLSVIPESMDYIASVSVNGGNLVKLPQVDKMLTLLSTMSVGSTANIRPVLTTFNGPVAVGLLHDATIDDWNGVIAAKSSDPNAVMNLVSGFASAMGQDPELNEQNEYIYEWDNKMVTMGNKNGVIYIKVLNYEQTEGYASEDKAAVDFFGKAVMGMYVRSTLGGNGGTMHFGMTDHFTLKGQFVPASDKVNPALAMLHVLCDVKSATLFDDNGGDFAFDNRNNALESNF